MANVNTITLEQLDRLGIDDHNNLYWDGRPLKTEEHIVLNRAVNISAIVAAASTFSTAVIEILRFFGYGVR